MDNPYLVDDTVRVSVVLPIDRADAWTFIATVDGYRRWFPTDCEGRFEVGALVRATWWWGDAGTTEHRVLALEPRRLIEFDWSTVDGSSVRYEIAGGPNRPTVGSIVATYPQTSAGRAGQLLDVAPWTFAALNLKSVASGGIDLRHRGARPDGERAYID